MTTFCVGRSVMEWVRLHQESGFDVLRHVDVRRLVQFGVIKGLLYRVHKYAVSKSYLSLLATGRRGTGVSEIGGKGGKNVDGRDNNNNKNNNNNNNSSNSGKDKGKSKEKGKEKVKEKVKDKGKMVEAKSPATDDGLVMKMGRQRINRLLSRDSEDEDQDNASYVDEEGEEDGKDNDNDTNSNDEEGRWGGERRYPHDAAKTRRKMQRYLDGRHSFDQIITEQNLTDTEIMRKIKSFDPDDVPILYR